MRTIRLELLRLSRDLMKGYVGLPVLTERKQKKDDDEMMEGSCLSFPPPLPLSHFSPPSGAVC